MSDSKPLPKCKGSRPPRDTAVWHADWRIMTAANEVGFVDFAKKNM